jgi:hypothetical protein
MGLIKSEPRLIMEQRLIAGKDMADYNSFKEQSILQ